MDRNPLVHQVTGALTSIMSITFVEIVGRYGSVPLLFASYRKGEFTFRGVAPDGTQLRAIYGDPAHPYDVPHFAKDTAIYLDPAREPDWHPLSILITQTDGTADEWISSQESQ
jgi:hypothetical protein